LNALFEARSVEGPASTAFICSAKLQPGLDFPA